MDSVFQKPLDDDIQDVAECMAIVINGDTAPQAISSGQYLFIKNHSTAAIASGGSVTSSNVAADANGIVNAAYSSLNGKMPTYSDVSVTTNTNGLFYPTVPTGAIVMNVINQSASTYAIVQFGNASFIAFDASVGGWTRASEKTFTNDLTK